ncbi:hypothetical protein [Amycolatopsis sp. NPDC051128]|uniref:hypothetical protein n=1 Tax=Amycolatopsis sp. NPDC051128 TaxID=3155412 RepID=UPI0034289C26
MTRNVLSSSVTGPAPITLSAAPACAAEPICMPAMPALCAGTCACVEPGAVWALAFSTMTEPTPTTLSVATTTSAVRTLARPVMPR